jgi:hypothetical protein
MIRLAPALLLSGVLAGVLSGALAFPQTHTMSEGAHRMELSLERLDANAWRTIDPGLVLAQGDRVRFKFRTNFDGYLYVMNQSTSGTYEQLFPRQETGEDNRVTASKEYRVPATSAAFRIAGPAGHEIVYWLVSPARLNDPSRPTLPPPAPKGPPPTLIPRCDDAILKARGDCVDSSAGPKLVPRGEQIPENLTGAGATRTQRDLLFMRQKNTAVISSPDPLTGPIIYEFRLAHK